MLDHKCSGAHFFVFGHVFIEKKKPTEHPCVPPKALTWREFSKDLEELNNAAPL